MRFFSSTITIKKAGAAVVLLFLIASIFPFASRVFAAEIEYAVEVARLYLDEETITKGYTVETPGKDLKVGVVDRAVIVPVEVVLKDIPASHFPVDSKTREKVSDILEYDIRHDVGGGKTESLGVLEKPVYIAIEYNADTVNKKIVHYWNKPSQQWVPLPTTTDFDNNLARAVSYFPYSRLAVFDDPLVYEGPASWYVSGFHCECAASPTYVRKSRLLVTNIDPDSNKHGHSMIIRVNDYGPDPDIHPDRPIDLDKVAFAELADSVGSGIMTVRVEPINAENSEKYEWVIEKEQARLDKRVAGIATSIFDGIASAQIDEESEEEAEELSEKAEEESTQAEESLEESTDVIQKSQIKFKSDF